MPDTLNHDDDLNLTIGEPEDDKEGQKGLKALFASKLFIVAMVLVLAAGGLTVWTIMKKPAEKPVKEEASVQEIPKPAKKHVFFPRIIDMGMFEVPLGDKGGQLSLKVGIRVEAGSIEVKQEFDRRSIQIRGSVTSTISIKTLNELAGVDGKILLKKELITALNRIIETGRVLNVYFYEFVIQ